METEKKESSQTGSENKIPNIDPEKTEEKTPEEKKRPIGRPPGSGKKQKEKPAKYSIIDKDLCKVFAGVIPFSLLSYLTKNKDYNLTETEKESLAPLWDAIFNKHLPEVVSDYKEEVTLATAIGILIISKSDIVKILSEKKIEKEEEKPHKSELDEEIISVEKDVTNF